ncbi:hypothetical protein [Roseovarius sp.]|uniref:hypothetical protein n=1 Tax=Roseovarius sp. TaxID=1486281 RepID=UPI00356A4F22
MHGNFWISIAPDRDEAPKPAVAAIPDGAGLPIPGLFKIQDEAAFRSNSEEPEELQSGAIQGETSTCTITARQTPDSGSKTYAKNVKPARADLKNENPGATAIATGVKSVCETFPLPHENSPIWVDAPEIILRHFCGVAV